MRFGLSALLLGQRSIDARELLELRKAGFERGPVAAHKYWKRVRIMRDGKPAWKYYYNNPKDRERWARERAEALHQQRGTVQQLEEMAREEHGTKAEYHKDHPLLTARKRLQELSVEYVKEILTWDRPPSVVLTPAVQTEYHKAICDLYGEAEPDDPHGKPMSVMRVMDLAFSAMPATIKAHFSDAINNGLFFGTTEEDPHFAQAYGYCDPSGKKSKIAIDMKSTSAKAAAMRGAHMGGGMFPVEVVVHEMAHAIHNQLGADGRWYSGDGGPPGWKGKTFADYEKFMATEGKDEQRITQYAHFNIKECWAESWTAAIVYPRALASVAPRQYEWWREFFGHDHMRPLRTDQAAVDKAQADLTAATAAGDLQKAADARKAIDLNTGILDMAEDDKRLQWWLPKTTHVQRLLDEYHRHQRMQGDPFALTTKRLPDDKFYQMSIGGRTIFMRIGRKDEDAPPVVWRPGEQLPGNLELKTSEIKEVYDAEGNPLSNDTAWWYLNQDGLPDGHPDIGGLGTFLDRGEKSGPNDKAIGKFVLNKKLSAIANAAGQGKLGKAGFSESHVPVEMSPAEFRLRSGCFAYDAFDMAGAHELSQLANADLPHSKRVELEEAFKKKQPGVELVTSQVTQHDVDSGEINPTTGKPYTAKDKGRWKKPTIARAAVEPGQAAVPVMRSIRYVNDNPDGTSTVINVTRRDSGPGRGFYYIDSPVWRALLTPTDGNVESAHHLKELCARAAAERRRVWVSIKTDAKGGDTEHYYHVQLEFDGRGQPKLIGDEWKRRLGKDTPRLDDLLSPGTTVGSVEVSRPMIVAEPVKMKKPRAKGKLVLPAVGDTAILEVQNAEVGRRVDDPPGWSRMPEGTPPIPEPGKAQALWKIERQWKAQGILPTNYNGSIEQRKWMGAFLRPQMTAWEEKQKRPVRAALTAIVPAKKAGDPPPPPGWDRMPEGFDAFPDVVPDEPGNKLSKEEKRWKKEGVLPAHYEATATQRKWVEEHLRPATKVWQETLEEVTALELPAQYIFSCQPGSGFPGRVIRRWGEDHLKRTLRMPFEGTTPEALQSDTLVYNHVTYNPVNGDVIKEELRLLPPKDGSITEKMLEGVPGVTLLRDKKDAPVQGIRVSIDGFNRFRQIVGAVSLTSDAENMVRRHTDTLKAAAQRAQRAEHVIDIESLTDIDALSKGAVAGFGPVDLRPTGPNGAPFLLAEHQKELVQLTLDNDGRALGAHYMGTGKTISAIVTAKVAMARRDPNDPTKPHPRAPKKVLIVAPLNTVEQWRQATFDYSSGCTVVGAGASDVPADTYLDNVNKGVDTSDIVVVGPEYFTLNQEKLRKAGFDGLIVDEAHMGLKNENAERNKAINEWNPDMKLLQLLTGTPITTGPSDIMEYVKLLSQGQQWAGMSKADFVEQYLELSAVPGEAGGKDKGPKIQIKPAKRAELASIIAQWTHIAMPKDVKGKTLPAVRIEENKHAEMTGTQSLLYAMHMAALSDADRLKLASAGATLSEDELAGLGSEAKKKVATAKAIANCLAYKPASQDQYVMVKRKVPGAKAGTFKDEKVIFNTFDPTWLMERPDLPANIKKKLAGRWPSVDDIGGEVAAAYGAHRLLTILGVDNYEQLAGRKITQEQLKAMRDAGWPKPVANPDAGPVGIRCRGSDTAKTDPAYLARRAKAIEFQRVYGSLIRDGIFDPTTGKARKLNPEEALVAAAARQGVDEDEALALLGTRPDEHDHSTVVSMNGVTVHEGETWFSDVRGSLHLLYRAEDWDQENSRPRSAGGFEKVRDGDRVLLPTKYVPKPEIPKGVSKEVRQQMLDDWTPPEMTYDHGATLAEDAAGGPNKGLAAIRRRDTGEIIWVPKTAVSAAVASLMDPGMRRERAKADVAMVVGNAKAEELQLQIQEFHRVTATGDAGDGRYGARQMVLFANGILDGCRTIEASLRTLGFKDVNEALEGSPHYDPDDPNPGGNGKFFVTYIGSTYTGDRDLNAEIFKKRKDKLGRDLPESLFVHKTNVGRQWRLWPAADPHSAINLSQWTPEQREAIYKQFKVRAPEAFYTAPDGSKKFFYGSKTKVTVAGKTFAGSDALMREMVLAGDPTRMGIPRPQLEAMKPEELAATAERMGLGAAATVDDVLNAQGKRADAVREYLGKLEAAYEGLVKAEAKTDPPLTLKQTNVFNNCEMIVCSDAAQVGLNFGNAVEMVNYDSLGSPMAEWQRITRSARMLPPAVADELWGKPIMEPVDANGAPMVNDDGTPAMAPKRDSKGRIVRDMTGPFAKIRALEPSLFQAAPRGGPQGFVKDVTFAGTAFPKGELSFQDALTRMIQHANDAAEKSDNKEHRAAWQRIAKKAQVARNLGTTAALAFYREMEQTQVPGGTGNVLEMGDPQYQDPTEGTYDVVETADADAAIRKAIDTHLSEAERAQIAKAGFVPPGADGKSGGSLDATGIYLALRSTEILDHIEQQREVVGARMRAAPGGAVVTDADVMNAVIDSLTPSDRAILKKQKYLVNVRKLAVSAYVPQMTVVPGEDGEEPRAVFTGFEKQHPIDTERKTRNVARARMTAVEQLWADVQAKTPVHTDFDYETTTAADIANVSRMDIHKSLRPALPLGGFRGAAA